MISVSIADLKVHERMAPRVDYLHEDVRVLKGGFAAVRATGTESARR